MLQAEDRYSCPSCSYENLNTCCPIPLLYFPVKRLLLRFADSVFDSSSTSFIGCWWLPYLIFGALVFLSAIPMLFCPKHLPHYYKMKARLRKLKKMRKIPSIEDIKPVGFKAKMKGTGQLRLSCDPVSGHNNDCRGEQPPFVKSLLCFQWQGRPSGACSPTCRT